MFFFILSMFLKNFLVFFYFLNIFVFFNVVFLFLLKRKRTKLQIWFIFHGQITFSCCDLYTQYILVFSLYKW